ncbi:hypothetical protein ACFIQG_19280 [Comamonas odontotermitis]|uniref:hypothetical protein n=1 Tax=Comamonas odontotermitis TaxID=379895 RepID=UPI00366DD83C
MVIKLFGGLRGERSHHHLSRLPRRLRFLAFWFLVFALLIVAIVIKPIAMNTTTSITNSQLWPASSIWFTPAMGSNLVPVDTVAYLLVTFFAIQLLLAVLVLIGVWLAVSYWSEERS